MLFTSTTPQNLTGSVISQDCSLGDVDADVKDCSLGDVDSDVKDCSLGDVDADVKDCSLGDVDADVKDCSLGDVDADVKDILVVQRQRGLCAVMCEAKEYVCIEHMKQHRTTRRQQTDR